MRTPHHSQIDDLLFGNSRTLLTVREETWSKLSLPAYHHHHRHPNPQPTTLKLIPLINMYLVSIFTPYFCFCEWYRQLEILFKIQNTNLYWQGRLRLVSVLATNVPSITDVHLNKNISKSLSFFMNFHDFSVHQVEGSGWLVWIVDDYLLLGWEKTLTAATEEVIEVYEGNGEDHWHGKENSKETVIKMMEDVWIREHRETHHSTEEDEGANTNGHVDLGVLHTEHHPVVTGVTPAEVVRFGECEECE